MANQLESLEIGAHPILTPVFERLTLRPCLEQVLGPPDRRLAIPHVDMALLMVRNIVLCRHPLYETGQWAARFVPDQLGLDAEQLARINDDRLGRTLDRLFEADLASATTRIVVKAVEAFEVDLSRLHNDSTSITFTGAYLPRRPRLGRRPVEMTHGYNKDHRPDLKQLLWVLTVSADGAVPVHYNVYDGNVSDDQTHIETWDCLCQIRGGSDFVYVADSKLCTREQMGHIDARGGSFLTVLPRTRREDTRFRRWLKDHETGWEVVWRRSHPRHEGGAMETFEVASVPDATVEGYRVVWFRSSEKRKRDARAREDAIDAAQQQIEALRDRVGRRRLKTREQVKEAVEKILEETRARPWVTVDLAERLKFWHKQEGPGRPGSNTRYLRQHQTTYEPILAVDQDAVHASATADGVFPLVTNLDAERTSAPDLLKMYKYQPHVEKRHELLKTGLGVVPMNFKTRERIEAFLFLYFLAELIHALIERKVRREMKRRGVGSIPIYPEERACRRPTAVHVLDLFDRLRRHRLLREGQPVETFWDGLTDVQRTVLDLLGISSTEYGE